jgi:hypothetical protein
MLGAGSRDLILNGWAAVGYERICKSTRKETQCIDGVSKKGTVGLAFARFQLSASSDFGMLRIGGLVRHPTRCVTTPQEFAFLLPASIAPGVLNVGDSACSISDGPNSV